MHDRAETQFRPGLNNPVNYTDPSGNVPKWVKNRSDHSYKTHDTGDSYMGHKYVYKGESTSGGSWDPNPTRTYETYKEKSYSRSTTTTINYKYYKTGNTYNEEYGWSSFVLDAVNVEYKVSGSQSKTVRIYAYEIAVENQRLIETSVGEIDLDWNETSVRIDITDLKDAPLSKILNRIDSAAHIMNSLYPVIDDSEYYLELEESFEGTSQTIYNTIINLDRVGSGQTDDY